MQDYSTPHVDINNGHSGFAEILNLAPMNLPTAEDFSTAISVTKVLEARFPPPPPLPFFCIDFGTIEQSRNTGYVVCNHHCTGCFVAMGKDLNTAILHVNKEDNTHKLVDLGQHESGHEDYFGYTIAILNSDLASSEVASSSKGCPIPSSSLEDSCEQIQQV